MLLEIVDQSIVTSEEEILKVRTVRVGTDFTFFSVMQRFNEQIAREQVSTVHTLGFTFFLHFTSTRSSSRA